MGLICPAGIKVNIVHYYSDYRLSDLRVYVNCTRGDRLTFQSRSKNCYIYFLVSIEKIIVDCRMCPCLSFDVMKDAEMRQQICRSISWKQNYPKMIKVTFSLPLPPFFSDIFLVGKRTLRFLSFIFEAPSIQLRLSARRMTEWTCTEARIGLHLSSQNQK